MRKLILTFFTLLFITSGFAQSFNGNMANKRPDTFKESINTTDAKIYPNPCKQEKVTIELNNDQIKEIRLSNILGKEVLVKNYPNAENTKQIELDDVPNGLYLLQITTSSNKTVVKKLMVSRN